MANTIDIRGDEVVLAEVASRTIAEFNDDQLSYIGEDAFGYCSALTSISLPNAVTLDSKAFQYCCSLSSVNLPKVELLSTDAFYYCTALKSVSLPMASIIGTRAFGSCYSLSAVYLLSNSVCKAGGTNIFISTPMSASSYLGYYGSIYVPSSLVSAYKSATNWTYFADRITAYTGE